MVEKCFFFLENVVLTPPPLKFISSLFRLRLKLPLYLPACWFLSVTCFYHIMRTFWLFCDLLKLFVQLNTTKTRVDGVMTKCSRHGSFPRHAERIKDTVKEQHTASCWSATLKTLWCRQSNLV